MDRVGLVISHLYQNMQLENYVLQLENIVDQDRNPSKVYWVHKKAFTLLDEDKNQEVSIRKNLKRRAERHLFFGDIIEWTDEKSHGQSNTITRFTRGKKLFESRCENGKCQIKLEGCIDPNKHNRFWSPNFPFIHIKGNNKLALPNVYLEAWVSIELNDDRCVQFDLDRIAGVCPPEEQGNVGKAPWNINNLKYNTICLVEFDDDDELFEDFPSSPDVPLLEINSLMAFAVSDRSFYAETHPTLIFSLVVFDEPVVSGSYYKLNAMWNRFDEYYMVTKAVIKKDLKNFPIDETGRIRCTVKQFDYPGVFVNETLGFMDDPLNLFALLSITPYRTSSFMVAIEDGIPTRSFRFRIVGVIDSKNRLNNFINKCGETVEVKHLPGFAISNKHVFCLQHSQMTFKIPSTITIPPLGKYLKFDAVFDPMKKVFEVTNWKADESLPAITVMTNEVDHNVYKNIFKTTVQRIVKKDLKGFLQSPEFGLVDDRGIAKSIQEGRSTVWVAHTESDSENGMRKSRTPFELVHIGENADCLNFYDSQRNKQFENVPSISGSSHQQQPEARHNFDKNDDFSTTKPDSLMAGYYPSSVQMSMNDGDENLDELDEAATLNKKLLAHRKEMTNSRSYIGHSNYSESIPSVSSHRRAEFGDDMSFERYDMLKNQYSHSSGCSQMSCVKECTFLRALVLEVLENDDFYRQLREYYPKIANDVKNKVESFSCTSQRT